MATHESTLIIIYVSQTSITARDEDGKNNRLIRNNYNNFFSPVYLTAYCSFERYSYDLWETDVLSPSHECAFDLNFMLVQAVRPPYKSLGVPVPLTLCETGNVFFRV